jgi:hypothetical protein
MLMRIVTFLVGLGGDFFAEHLLEEIRVGQLFGGGLLQQRF